MSVKFMPSSPPGPRPDDQQIEQLLRSWRKTSTETLEEMKAACITNDISRFKTIFDNWVSYGHNIHDLADVMQEAVNRDNVEIVLTFLSHGQPTYWSYTLDAIEHRSKGVLAAFPQSGWDINEPTAETKPLVLGYAVKDEEMTIWLLNHGADPNIQCRIDLTPLSWAIEDASLSTIKLFFDRGADVHKGEPLHHAINRKSGVVEVLELLLKQGAPLNAKMYENHPLSRNLYLFMGLGPVIHQAAWQGKVDAVCYLLAQGADPTIKDATNRTALDWAVKCKHSEIVTILKSAMEIEIEIENA